MILEDLNRNDLEKIKKECSEFIKHNDQPLWRGMRDRGGLSQVKIRTDRKPLSTGVIDNILYNYIFEVKYKIKDIRKKIAYVSTSTNQAKNYGSLHAIFPINGTKMIFNQMVQDSAYMMETLTGVFSDVLSVALGEDDIMKVSELVYSMESNTQIHDFDSFVDVLKNKLVSMGYDRFNLRKVFADFRHEAENMRKISGYKLISTNHSLPGFFGNETEIGLFDAPYYYAISDSAMPPPQYYKEWLNSTLRN